MPTYKDDDETPSIFMLNHVSSQFGVPQAFVIMTDITTKLGLHCDNSTPYYQ